MKGIINDRDALEQYINTLPELETGEVYFYSVLSRGKYNSTVKNEHQLDRDVASSKEILLRKILQLEKPLDNYTWDGNILPTDSIVLYISINPRSETKALYSTVYSISENLRKVEKYNDLAIFNTKNKVDELIENFDETGVTIDDLKKIKKILVENRPKVIPAKRQAMNAIQTSMSRRILTDVDIDDVEGVLTDVGVIETIRGILADDTIHGVIKTRGGYHVQIRTDRMDKKSSGNWLLSLRNHYKNTSVEVEMKGDSLTPLPGGTQGGFVPKLLAAYVGDSFQMISSIWSGLDVKDNVQTIILDPDGWDRTNFEWSYYTELVTEETFESRKLISTVLKKQINK